MCTTECKTSPAYLSLEMYDLCRPRWNHYPHHRTLFLSWISGSECNAGPVRPCGMVGEASIGHHGLNRDTYSVAHRLIRSICAADDRIDQSGTSPRFVSKIRPCAAQRGSLRVFIACLTPLHNSPSLKSLVACRP